jgi:hypothetical protein
MMVAIILQDGQKSPARRQRGTLLDCCHHLRVLEVQLA